jgi:hypothetical protein
MEKFCIFCGQQPENKTKEHVIPQWLIERTGDPKRMARFGIDFHKNPPEPREFSFDALTFPACSRCNSDFSALEGRAKSVLESVLASQPLSREDLSTFLDWLDKVRIGLWLGYLYLDRNPVGIFPKYHIAKRLGQLDRTVAIVRVDRERQGVNFVGPESPAFQGTPTCFALLINEFCFLNTSGIASCSRRLGLPYACPRHLRDDGALEITVEQGNGRIMRPVQRDLVLAGAVVLHQPIFRHGFTKAEATKLLDTELLREESVDWGNGCGPVFLEKSGTVRTYPREKSLDWFPDRTWTFEETYDRIARFVYQRLIRDLRDGAKISGRERRRRMQEGITAFSRLHAAFLTALDRAHGREQS